MLHRLQLSASWASKATSKLIKTMHKGCFLALHAVRLHSLHPYGYGVFPKKKKREKLIQISYYKQCLTCS